MTVGCFTDCRVHPTCGMATADHLMTENIPAEFFMAERVNAQLLWFSKGIVEYRFPNTVPREKKIKSLTLSAELCSEAPKYRSDWASDITVWINDVDIGS